MSCWQCPRYSRSERRCQDGKANPKRKSDSILVAELLGIRALCHYNPYRDSLSLRMFFPSDPLTVQASARSKRTKGNRRILPPERTKESEVRSSTRQAVDKE